MVLRGRNLFIGIGMITFFLTLKSASALTEISKNAEVRADPETTDMIVDRFDQAEAALEEEDLSELMEAYSDQYLNRGLRKKETSLIWEDLFRRYDRLSSRHFFSKVLLDPDGKKAKVTCTGSLFGTPVLRKGSGSDPVQIDTWFEAVHYLVFEDGEWRIIGHDPSEKERDQFGSAIHLLF